MKITIVTSQNAAKMTKDDPVLVTALEKSGHDASLRRWDDESVAWQDSDISLIRSTWDYFERAEEFSQWLTSVQSKTRLVNDAKILTWNFNKKYLLELEAAGIPIVPTTICEIGQVEATVQALCQSGESAIVKPVVSGGSWGLHHVKDPSTLMLDPAQAPWLVQPFVPSICDKGELSVIVLGGEVSHGIRKRPKSGEIRIQKEFGGQYSVEVPSQEASDIALRALDVSPGEAMYARVDLIERGGELHLMELELIEPELFFTMVPKAADRLASLLS